MTSIIPIPNNPQIQDWPHPTDDDVINAGARMIRFYKGFISVSDPTAEVYRTVAKDVYAAMLAASASPKDDLR